MDRRNFLKSIGLGSLAPVITPALSGLSFAKATLAPSATAPLISAQTYKWAEMLVRAHDNCNISMLERLLQLDNAAAVELRNRLLENGVITHAKTAYGSHKAVKPLYKEIMPGNQMNPVSTHSLKDDLAKETPPQEDSLEEVPFEEPQAQPELTEEDRIENTQTANQEAASETSNEASANKISANDNLNIDDLNRSDLDRDNLSQNAISQA